MRVFLLVFHMIITLIMIGVILIQKGEDASAGSGGGLPGARSGKNFLTHATAFLASIFLIGCVVMARWVREESKINISSTTKKKPSLENKKDTPQDGVKVEAPQNPSPVSSPALGVTTEKTEASIHSASPSSPVSTHPTPSPKDAMALPGAVSSGVPAMVTENKAVVAAPSALLPAGEKNVTQGKGGVREAKKTTSSKITSSPSKIKKSPLGASKKKKVTKSRKSGTPQNQGQTQAQ